jgi:hypothetical protein
MEGYCSTGQSPPRAVVPMEEEKKKIGSTFRPFSQVTASLHLKASLLCDCYQKDERALSVSAFSLP